MKKIILVLLTALLASCVNTPKNYFVMELGDLMACEELTAKHGYVVEQTYEGYSEYNDYYIVNIDGELYEVEADDLNVGDKVTCYFVNEEEVVRTLYEWR